MRVVVTRRTSIGTATVVACLVLRFAAIAAAQPPEPKPAFPDVQKLGPQIGDRVPDFTLTDQRGQARTLASLMGPKGLMLVFNRSADW
jgi:cytochrome oxidase Cu insertion factor (SCO1/SenC/PrrC family)